MCSLKTKQHSVSFILRLFLISFLVGLNDKGVESEFKWSDSSNVEYTNWGANQPDDWFSREDCVHVRKNGRWNDLKCDSSLGYICKKPKGMHFHHP